MPRWTPIAALAVLGCLLAACGPVAPDPTTSGPVPKTAPPTTAPPATTSTTRGKAATSTSYRWSRLSAPALLLGGGGGTTSTLSAVLPPPAVGDHWLMAGTRKAANGATDATIWSSTDASSWTATGLRGGIGGQARAATVWGQRTVVVGSVGSGQAQRAAVWISPDPGAPFSPVPDSPTLGVPASTAPDPSAGSAEPAGDSATLATTAPPGAVMDSVTAGALGVFASGTVGGQLALWYSTNGTAWIQLTKAESVINSSPGAVVREILETQAGVYAVGSVLHADTTDHVDTTDAALWTSGDGINWRPGPIASSFTGPGDQMLSSISTFGTNLVVAGGIRLASTWMPASWISPNLFSWGAPSESFPEPTGERLDLTGSVVAGVSVSPDGTTLAAVGGSPSEQRLWLSTDGINWTPVPFPQAAADDADWTAGAVATTGTTTVVIDPNPGQPRVLVDGVKGWREVTAEPGTFGSPQAVATPTHLVDDAGRLVMTVDVKQPGQQLGQDRDSTEILTSPNGHHWSVAATGNTFLDQTVTGLAVTDGGLVALGGPSATTAAVASGDFPNEPALTVWRSTDATRWTTVRLDAQGVVAVSALTSGRPSPSSMPAASTPVASTSPGLTTTASTSTASTSARATTAPPTTRQQAPTSGSTTTAPRTAASASSTTAPKATAGPDSTTTSPASATMRTPSSTHPATAPEPIVPAPAEYQVPVGAVGSKGNTLYVVSSFGGGPAIGWKSTNGANWTPMGTLTGEPAAEPDTVSGNCATPVAAVVVGQEASGQGGSVGKAWNVGGAAVPATLTPARPTDGAEELLGCSDTAGGSLVAWGASASTSGIPTAALWSSANGTVWTRRTISAFATTDGTAAITDLATNGNTWLAVTGSATKPWTQDSLSTLGLWESTDAGKTWQELTTATATWSSVFGVSADLVAYYGIDPVIAGQTDGRLTVWMGTPTS
jgi:hypothetical protein